CHATKEWQCDLGICIPRIWRCNGVPDCPGIHDVSDETGCPQRSGRPPSIRRGHHPRRTHHHGGQTHKSLSLSPQLDPAEDSRTPRRLSDVLFVSDDWTVADAYRRRPLPADTFTTSTNTPDPFESNTVPYRHHTPPSWATPRPYYSDPISDRQPPRHPSDSGRHTTSSDRRDPSSSWQEGHYSYPTSYYGTTTRRPDPTQAYPDPRLYHYPTTRDPYVDVSGFPRGYPRPTRHPAINTTYHANPAPNYYSSTTSERYPTLDARRGYPSSVATYSPTDELYRPPRYPTTAPDVNTIADRSPPTRPSWYPAAEEVSTPQTPYDPRKPQSSWGQYPSTVGEKAPSACDDRLHYTCANGQCIGKSLLCDGLNDCRDKSDESSCTNLHCAPTEFRCGDGSCIPNSARCDGRKDCRDGKDEGPHCPSLPLLAVEGTPANQSADLARSGSCKPGEFRCSDGSCIHGGRRCDRIIDCRQGEDEMGCEVDRGCAASEFKCPQDGLCIRQNQLCDGVLDCTGGDDETNCGHHRGTSEGHSHDKSNDVGRTHHPKHPNLPDNSASSNEERRRDHERRWRQEMDRRRVEDERRAQQQQQYEQEIARRRAEEARRSREHWERKERQQEEEERLKHKEEAAKKVDDALKWFEDALKEANTGSETGAGLSRHGQCLPGEFACRTHDQCVAADRHCDRRRDCFDGSDEANCCSSGELQCGDGSCVLSHTRCDGRRDCPDGADELNCPDQKLCGASKFHCGDGQCIKDVLRCDGYYDCNNFADEQNCVSDIDVRVYPPFQNETEGHNVVIRCRDEGPRRLKVRWARADGRPLKTGHSEHRGRLTLPRVTSDDAGVYLCVPLAVDGQELRPSQKSATLVVTTRVYPPSPAPIPPHSRSYDPYYNYVTEQVRQRQRRQRSLAAKKDSPEVLFSRANLQHAGPMQA
ncbi:low-density lipoprotein receptor-like, partial [Tropilaelaps mercedesae]